MCAPPATRSPAASTSSSPNSKRAFVRSRRAFQLTWWSSQEAGAARSGRNGRQQAAARAETRAVAERATGARRAQAPSRAAPFTTGQVVSGMELVARDRGTPQGSAISPLLANIFLHYAFDAWMGREIPAVPFERYADDVILHCKTSGKHGTSRRDHRADGAARPGAPSGQDAHRVLQGLKPPRLSRARTVRLPRVHVSSAAGAAAGLVSSSASSRQSATTRQGDPPAGQALAAAPAQRTRPSPTSHERSTRSCGAGSTTTAASTGPS